MPMCRKCGIIFKKTGVGKKETLCSKCWFEVKSHNAKNNALGIKSDKTYKIPLREIEVWCC